MSGVIVLISPCLKFSAIFSIDKLLSLAISLLSKSSDVWAIRLLLL